MQENKQLLILDLDETLIYASEQRLKHKYDFATDEYFVYIRPYTQEFIIECSKIFELAVWTSSGKIYANEVVKNVFPHQIHLSFIWTRDRCTYAFDFEKQEYHWIKDLKKVRRRGYCLEKVLMVDDSPEKLKRNYGNLIRIAPYTGDCEDKELQLLLVYLKKILQVPNIRSIEKRYWRIK